MAGGGGHESYISPPLTGVWWDLNTCPVPDDFDPRCVDRCIKSALHEQIRIPTAVAIYAIGNLEYMSLDLLEKISSSGIALIHAPCGGNNLINFLYEWSDEQQHEPSRPGSGYIMLISGDSTMVNRCRLKEFSKFSKICAYPKAVGPVTTLDNQGEKVFVKELVWETLLSVNPSPCVTREADEEPCMCQVCHVVSETCKDFVTHLRSEQHRARLFGIVPVDYDGNPRYFCPVCNYPAYDEFNMSLHNESEDHIHKLADKEQPPQAEDCESRKRNPQVDLFNEINKKQSLERP
ncbi:hypothetical protein Bca4012_035702 [Brassica carinata]